LALLRLTRREQAVFTFERTEDAGGAPQATMTAQGQKCPKRLRLRLASREALQNTRGFGIGLALVENGRRVLFSRTTDLVQKLQIAGGELPLEALINLLDRFNSLIL
jgi:hypothetical protein